MLRAAFGPRSQERHERLELEVQAVHQPRVAAPQLPGIVGTMVGTYAMPSQYDVSTHGLDPRYRTLNLASHVSGPMSAAREVNLISLYSP